MQPEWINPAEEPAEHQNRKVRWELIEQLLQENRDRQDPVAKPRPEPRAADAEKPVTERVERAEFRDEFSRAVRQQSKGWPPDLPGGHAATPLLASGTPTGESIVRPDQSRAVRLPASSTAPAEREPEPRDMWRMMQQFLAAQQDESAAVSAAPAPVARPEIPREAPAPAHPPLPSAQAPGDVVQWLGQIEQTLERLERAAAADTERLQREQQQREQERYALYEQVQTHMIDIQQRISRLETSLSAASRPAPVEPITGTRRKNALWELNGTSTAVKA